MAVKDRLLKWLAVVTLLIGLFAGGAGVIDFFKYYNLDGIASFMGLVYSGAYLFLVIAKTSIGGKTAEEKAYSRGFNDGQVQQEEKNLLAIADAARSRHQQGYKEGFVAGAKSRQPAAPSWYNELSERDKELFKLILSLPDEKKCLLLQLAEQMQLPRSQETD